MQTPMVSEPPRCRPVPVLALKGATPHGASTAATRRGTGPPQVLEAQGVVGRSRQVGPIRTASQQVIRMHHEPCSEASRVRVEYEQWRQT